MKAYKLEVFIIDFDDVGKEEIVDILENAHYPNRCISPNVKNIIEKDIGEWNDDHPLNKKDTYDQTYLDLFQGGTK